MDDVNKGRIRKHLTNISRIFFFACFFIIRGPEWSPLPMGFGIGILITEGNL